MLIGQEGPKLNQNMWLKIEDINILLLQLNNVILRAVILNA